MTRPEPQGIIVWGILSNKLDLLPNIENEITKDFGEIIVKSDIIPFNYTDYYESELGKDIKRLWLITSNLVNLSQLADIKNYARNLETKYADQDNNRKINIDPGILTLSNFILATTKNYGHRIYLRDGIFAEVTLIFRNKTFQKLDWTYPDYSNAIHFFNNARDEFIKLIKR